MNFKEYLNNEFNKIEKELNLMESKKNLSINEYEYLHKLKGAFFTLLDMKYYFEKLEVLKNE